MSRHCLVALLVVAVFLSGCRSSHQGGADPLTAPLNRVEDALWSAHEKCEDWFDRHPVAKDTARAVAGVALMVGIAALTALALWAYSQGDRSWFTGLNSVSLHGGLIPFSSVGRLPLSNRHGLALVW